MKNIKMRFLLFVLL